ncbi:SPFH/Band 7/PHB domain protein [Corynebacterium sp. MC-04]|uniref:SPFH/Band 7/PHB domain protein n=2 Tax=Corynebacteriaceae TaxID=1653 RepID=A0ABS9HJK0_9CORY|nr:MULTISPECIES: SPFH domain-containing protein [Corynebacterium]KXB51560.1 SPFH/Band 7/PHB domain protein [Corynebacterium kroppenstedtii]MBY0787673.1 SPFH/Band 7/PHB domain protein [Corynebacterium parakroppenstedtii]MBY0791746.1 SPFH/Band 7/PHB domain protein [Corynebacterium parakroppenstedtii]MBY0796496.1 SPFH/Band 7/PHB domain protein [Corynebacterium parakroppenstedtii]MCF6768697.1 SPFH/Band 7/PHB domain protein [Corynebacterium parakroppenstedtii]
MSAGTIVIVAIIVVIVLIIMMSIKLVPQGTAAVIERLGRYTKTVEGGITFLIPFVDRVRSRVDTRERVVSFPPQAVITQDNLTVAIDTVVTFQINDPMHSIYGVDNYLTGVEQTTTATLRDVVGGMTLEETLTSREVINRRLRGELDNATTKWGLRISRVELKAIDPPPSIQQSMEKQMKADREKRAMILTAEGQREADIKTAEGEKQARILAAEGEKHAAILQAEAERQAEILRAEGQRAARYLRAQGEARSIRKVNAAIKTSQVTPDVLAFQYLQKLPEMAEGSANKMWLIPSQFGDALESFTKQFSDKDSDGVFRYEAPSVDEETKAEAATDEDDDWFTTQSAPEIAKAVAEANAVANKTVDDPLDSALAAKRNTAKKLGEDPSTAGSESIDVAGADDQPNVDSPEDTSDE